MQVELVLDDRSMATLDEIEGVRHDANGDNQFQSPGDPQKANVSSATDAMLHIERVRPDESKPPLRTGCIEYREMRVQGFEGSNEPTATRHP